MSSATAEVVKNSLIVATLSMAPVSELRGGIPAGLVMHLPLTVVLPLAVLANIVAVIPVLLWLEPLVEVLGRVRVLGRFFDWVFGRARRRSEIVDRYGVLGLTLFVAIPLPVTGAWTGAVIAVLMGLPFWRSLACIALGVLIASVLVTLGCLGLLQIPFIERVVAQAVITFPAGR